MLHGVLADWNVRLRQHGQLARPLPRRPAALPVMPDPPVSPQGPPPAQEGCWPMSAKPQHAACCMPRSLCATAGRLPRTREAPNSAQSLEREPEMELARARQTVPYHGGDARPRISEFLGRGRPRRPTNLPARCATKNPSATRPSSARQIARSLLFYPVLYLYASFLLPGTFSKNKRGTTISSQSFTQERDPLS